MMIVAGNRVCSVCLRHLAVDSNGVYSCPKHGPRPRPINDAQRLHPIPNGKVYEGGAVIGKSESKGRKKGKKSRKRNKISDIYLKPL